MSFLPLGSGAFSGRWVPALGLALLIAAPVRGELWLESGQVIPRPPDEPLTYFASPELAGEIGGWGPLEFPDIYGPPTCVCGLPASCSCGACAGCCRCSFRRFGRAGVWLAAWDGTLELGLNGAEGNTRNTNLFFGFDGLRQHPGGSLKFDLDYFYQKADSLITADRFVALGRYEQALGSGPVTTYLETQYENDQLRNYDGRIAIAAGLAFPMTQAERLSLTGRLGAGASRKFGGHDDRWRPELQTGLDYEWRLTARQRVFGNLDYYPDMTRFRTFRLNFKLGWEALLEEEWGLAMRASLNNWHDSDPGPGTRANDLYYVLSLAWGY